MISAVCFDCANFEALPVPKPTPDGYICDHFRPEYWVKQGYQRNWGDAAVMLWPRLEILRKETKASGAIQPNDLVEYVILAPTIARRPITIFARGSDIQSWGGY